MNNTITRYRVLDLDVWGNEEDGYEVTDYRAICSIDLDNLEDANVIEELIKLDILTHKARELVEVRYFGGDYDMEIIQKETGKPLLDLIEIVKN